MALSFIYTSGNIISEDFCQQLVAESKVDYVKSKSFGDDVKKVDEDIATTFELLRERWEEVRVKIIDNKLDNNQLRDRWIKPFLSLLGFEPVFNQHNLKNNAAVEYHITYRGGENIQSPIIHMVHSSIDLDARDKNSRTHPIKSPHDLLQQYLNTSNHTWAILINGKKVRILRDFYHSITKGFIEFDLESIFESASTEQFRILYRLMHRSRFDGQFEKQANESDEPACLLEKFHTHSRDTGVKVGDNLRKQVRLAIETFGNGFAENINPDDFDDAKVKKFYSENLNIIYRLLFLLFAEQKGWLPVKNNIYARTYSINALRERAERGDFHHDNHQDLWEGLKVTFRLVTKGYTFPNGEKINAFGGQLFSDDRIYYIKSPLRNQHLLKAIDALCFFNDKGLKNKINYATLAIDELGSVYESLLDYEPRLLKENTEIGNTVYKRGTFILDDRSTERKTTGSYYTDSRLVAQLIDSALLPVIESAIKDKTTAEAKRTAILGLKVADIACGSGAFLIAALEKMGEYLALIGKEEGEKPTEDELRHAKREVLQNCIYGVDLNPMALELAKFSLWITASMPNFPLSFLDHKLKCGNSLVGATPDLIAKGIQAEAYNPVILDNKVVCAELKKRVKKELEVSFGKGKGLQTKMEFEPDKIENEEEVNHYHHILQSHQENADEVEILAHEYEEIYRSLRANAEWKLADAWTAAFFIVKDDLNKVYPTNVTLKVIEQGGQINEELEREILETTHKYHFFHWHLEFPEVFEKGGFDCILGNPPWEKINFKDEEFFVTRSPEIANANNKSLRKKLMDGLPETNPTLYNDYLNAKRLNDCFSVYFRDSGAYPLTGVSRVNLYSIFAEQYQTLINKHGATGNVLPSGIVLDNNNKDLYFYLIDNNKLDVVFDFENKKGIFPEVHRMYRFCLFVTVGKGGRNLYKFYQLEPNQTSEFVKITLNDIRTINPNSKTCPSFRNQKDYELAKKVYGKWRVLQNEDEPELNSWNVRIRTPFNMSNDSGLFKPYNQNLLPLYEAKYIYHYNHRYASWDGNTTQYLQESQLPNNELIVKSQYYIEPSELYSRFPVQKWCLVFRDITNATNERTMVATLLPNFSCGNTLSIVEIGEIQKELFLLVNFNSFTFDFFARQTVGGTHFNHWILKQLPVIEYNSIGKELRGRIQDTAFRLTYTAIDLKPMAEEYGCFDGPFTWNEGERFQLKCELDAIFGHLYGLTRDEFDYVLETFPIVKRRDIEKYGNFRTKETILGLYDGMDWVKGEIGKPL